MRIDYLHDGPPEMFGVLAGALRSRQLRTLGSVFLAGTCALSAVWYAEHVQVRDERSALQKLQLRVERGNIEAARVRAEIRSLENLRKLDGRVRQIKRSADLTVAKVSRVTNALPDSIWLTRMVLEETGVSLEGRSASLGALGTLLASDSAAALVSVHAPVDASRKIVDFTIRVDG